MKTKVRPDGAVKIEKSWCPHKDVKVARLSGAVRGNVAVVRKGRKYFFVAPKELGGTREVPASDLTDALHYEVGRMARKRGKR